VRGPERIGIERRVGVGHYRRDRVRDARRVPQLVGQRLELRWFVEHRASLTRAEILPADRLVVHEVSAMSEMERFSNVALQREPYARLALSGWRRVDRPAAFSLPWRARSSVDVDQAAPRAIGGRRPTSLGIRANQLRANRR